LLSSAIASALTCWTQAKSASDNSGGCAMWPEPGGEHRFTDFGERRQGRGRRAGHLDPETRAVDVNQDIGADCP
jgi:hypothetical protein